MYLGLYPSESTCWSTCVYYWESIWASADSYCRHCQWIAAIDDNIEWQDNIWSCSNRCSNKSGKLWWSSPEFKRPADWSEHDDCVKLRIECWCWVRDSPFSYFTQTADIISCFWNLHDNALLIECLSLAFYYFSRRRFAIPVDTVNRVVKQLLAYGEPRSASLGVICASREQASKLGIDGKCITFIHWFSSHINFRLLLSIYSALLIHIIKFCNQKIYVL